MLCLKKHHLVLILSLLALFAVPFLCSSGSVSAVSQSIVFDSSSDLSNNSLIYQDSNATYQGSPLLSFKPVYVEIKFTDTYNYDYYYCGPNGYGVLSIFQGTGYNFTPVVCFHSGLTFSISFDYLWNYSTHNMGLMIRPNQFSNLFSQGLTSITYTFYDSLPSTDCDPCPDCPPIPETPYGDILNKIYIAILAVSATALCIYFFYAFYNMFFGGIKR